MRDHLYREQVQRDWVLTYTQLLCRSCLPPHKICDVCSTNTSLGVHRVRAPAGVNGPTSGLSEIRFWGAGLGAHDYSPAVRLGFTASPRTRWGGGQSRL